MKLGDILTLHCTARIKVHPFDLNTESWDRPREHHNERTLAVARGMITRIRADRRKSATCKARPNGRATIHVRLTECRSTGSNKTWGVVGHEVRFEVDPSAVEGLPDGKVVEVGLAAEKSKEDEA